MFYTTIQKTKHSHKSLQQATVALYSFIYILRQAMELTAEWHYTDYIAFSKHNDC